MGRGVADGPVTSPRDEGGAPGSGKPPGKSSLTVRVLSALVMIPAALGIFHLGGWVLAAALLIVGVLMYHEWQGITGGDGVISVAAFGIILAAALALVVPGRLDVAWPVALASVPLAAFLALLRGRSVAWAAMGAAYVILPLISILWLRQHHPQGLAYTYWLLVVVWATDTGAYFAGSRIGGPKLAPRISPRKTWSGLAGGMLAAAILAAVLGQALGLALEPGALALIGAALAAWSQMGDLTESAVKRRFGVKDSGRIIPGHGGILDRVDGLIFAAPAVALILALS